MLSFKMSSSLDRGLMSALGCFGAEVVEKLSSLDLLKCSTESALKQLDLSGSIISKKSAKSSKVKKTAKPTVILPFCGVIVEDWCKGVKLNHGLHTQCTMGCKDDYCKTCTKQADGSATGKPSFGDIRDRAEFGVDYVDPKGKLTVPYANIVEKLKIDMTEAVAAAEVLGWTIPETQLVKRERSKKKSPKASKNEDQIAQLVTEAYAESNKTAANLAKEAALALLKSDKEAKKAASDLVKAEKDAVKVAKKAASDLVKAEKEAAKVAKKAALELAKADKEAAKVAKKAALELAKTAKVAAKALEKEEKAAAKVVEKELKAAAALKSKADKKALKLQKEVEVTPELVEDIIDSSDDEEEAELELSETMTVGDVEYYCAEQDGQTILFTKTGEPVGIYDAESESVQECEFGK
jgi:chemotaxis protein histidine kinase CheA